VVHLRGKDTFAKEYAIDWKAEQQKCLTSFIEKVMRLLSEAHREIEDLKHRYSRET